jgi:hypothetical protein
LKTNKFTRFYDFLAQMGLVLRDDPPKVIDLTGREWGEAAGGLALSLRELTRGDPAEVAGISIVMRNGGVLPRTLTVPPWIFFYEIAGADLSPYGRQLMTPDRKAKGMDVTLGAGDAIETDLPLATLYHMRAGESYRIGVSCRLPDETVLRSNEIMIRA